MTKDKNLLIFSGSTDPDIGDYKKRYDLVIEEAYHRGYSIVNFVNWTGQKSSGKRGALSMQTAVVDAITEIEKFNNLLHPFDLIAFSWGCGVALRSLQLMSDQIKYLDNIALWGISPYWVEYEAMEINKHQSIEYAYNFAGCIVDNNYLNYQIPIEYLLHSYNIDRKLKIGTCSEKHDNCFLNYIESIMSSKNVSFHYLDNLTHVVTEPNVDYFDFLF